MIRKKDLGTLHFIAEGGVGRVYRAPDYAPPGCPPLAFKEVLPTLPAQERAQALDSMTKAVAFRNALGPADRDDLDEYSTWPIEMVTDATGPCGLVMPLIPADFFLRTQPRTGPAKDVVFDLSWLSAKESQAQMQGIDRSAIRDVPIRIALLAQLVYAVGRLHKHGAVYGDLSLKNAALAVGPPRLKLLDCDAAAALTDTARVQLHSPFFTPPEMIAGTHRLQDTCTDVYKLGICIIRGLQQGPGVSQTKDPAPLARLLDAATVDAVARAVGADRAARPTAKELYGFLERNLLAKVSPPVLSTAGLSRPALLRGHDVEVVWTSHGGQEVRISGANGLEVVLPDRGTVPARHVVTPVASGEILVEVRNQHGTATLLAGTVTLYDLPPFALDVTGLPRPALPQLPAVTIPSALGALPPAPVVTTAAHPVPRPAVPSLQPVVDVVRGMRMAPSPMPRIDAAVADAAWSVRRALEPGPDVTGMGAAAAGAARNARGALDQAWADIRSRAAHQRTAARRRKGTP